jgi:YHS domain-containing protein
MRKIAAAFAVIVSLVFAVVPGFSARGVHKTPAKRPAARKVVSAVCPVMGGKISDIAKAAGKSVYKGKTYYFCCGGCKPMFDKNPRKYVGRK